MEKYLNTSLYADCSPRVYDCGLGLRGLAHAAKSCVGGLSQVCKCCGGCKCPARVFGVCPPSRTRRVYTHGVLLWLWPGCCSKVFLWADLTQPGGEFHWSKPVRAKSKG